MLRGRWLDRADLGLSLDAQPAAPPGETED
jgi:hypothetical protein